MTATTLFLSLSAACATLPPGLGRDGKIDEAGAAARAGHTAHTLTQIARYVSTEVSACDLALAYGHLGEGWSAVTGPERSRRWTCRQLARLCAEMAGEAHGTARARREALLRAAEAWDEIAAGFGRLAALGDVRGTAAAATHTAEAARLRAEAAALETLL